MPRDTPTDWLYGSTRYARANLRTAKEWIEKGDANYGLQELGSALQWGIAAWLRTRGYKPDYSNGWGTQLLQFDKLAPEALRGPTLHCWATVAGASIDIWEDQTKSYDEILSYCEDLHQRTADIIERLLDLEKQE